MKNIYNKLSFLIHPVLLSVYPVLFLYSYNIEQTAFKEIFLPVSLSTGISLILLSLIIIFSKNKFKSSLFISLLLLLFFSYGHVNKILYQVTGLKNLGYILSAVYLLILIVFTVLIIKSHNELNNITHLLNIISLSLILILCFSIIKFSIETSDIVIPEDDLEKKITSKNLNIQDLPDIYYIILDGYAGEETLKNVYNFDNSEFLDFLRSKGFFVASKSYSNYAHTVLSLPSSLNMMYINNIVNPSNGSARNTDLMIRLIENNLIQKQVKANGYTSIHISSRSLYTNRNQYADIVLNPMRINEFIFVLIKSTILSSIIDRLGISNIFGRRVINTVRLLSEIAKDTRLTYTFSHILVPHPPYIFNKTTKPLRYNSKDIMGFQWDNREGYINQLIAVNSIVKELILKIIKNSKIIPIIILQSDHGTASLLDNPKKGNWNNPNDSMLKERFNILNAYLVPPKIRRTIPSDISPVNTFRIIFNELFNTNFPLLENKYYFSPYDNNYELYNKTLRIN